MPENEPWTAGEIARAMIGFGESLQRIEGKLDQRPSWVSINRMEEARDKEIKNLQESRDKEQKLQDDAIKAVEDTIGKLMLTAIGSGLSAATAIVVAIVTR